MGDFREFDKPSIYRIRVKGMLDLKWSDWFDGFVIEDAGNNETMLTGSVPDQAALFGLLSKIRDLGLPLLTVSRQTQDSVDNVDIGNFSGVDYGSKAEADYVQ
jgi:hypothetical protein